MSDPILPARRAIYERLTAAVVGTPVHSRVPDNAEPPYVVIGSISLGPELAKSGSAFELTAEIDSVTQYRTPADCEALMGRVFDAIHQRPLAAAGFTLAPARLDSAVIEANEERTLWIGRQVFKTYGSR